MTKGTLFTHHENGTAYVTFAHPAGNSFPSDLISRLIDLIQKLDQDEKVKVIVLKSEGNGAFCAGANFDELLQIDSVEEGTKFFSGFANLIIAIRNCSKFIIGRAQGKAVGGGVGILAATDYCFATEAVSVKLSELSIGIGPYVIAPALERKMGKAALQELTINAENWHNAYWCKDKGLFAKVFENEREMDKEIEILTQKLSNYSLDAMVEMKQIFWRDTSHWNELLPEYASINGELVLSTFTKNALKKFKEKK